MYLVSQRGRWYAFCYWYDTKHGRRVRVRRSTGIRDDGSSSAKRRAHIIGEQIEQSLALGVNREVRQKTLQSAFKALVQRRELSQVSPQSVQRTIFAAQRWFDYFGPDKSLVDIKANALVKYALERGVAPNTVRREFTELAQAFKAVGEVPPEFPRLAPYKPRERWLDPGECARLLAEIPEKYRDHVVVYLQTGCRKKELYNLELVGSGVRIKGTKVKGADRVIPLTPQAREILERRQCHFENWHNMGRELLQAAARAGLGRISANDLRRSFASQLAQSGASNLHLKEFLGHSTTRMVDLVYARIGFGPHLEKTLGLLPPVQTTTEQTPSVLPGDSVDSGPETPPNVH